MFVPFTTHEIFHGREALYYGLNATSGNMILADRKKLKSANGLYLGSTGSGKSFAASLRTRTFAPDGPNYTPRISAVVYADGSYQMSILKSADGNGDSVQRYFFDYPQPVAGEGHFISTYKHNGNPIPSFEGEPLRFACPRTIGDFAHGLWQNLNPDNKVSFFARVIDLETGESGDMIFNKYDAVCSDLDDPEEPELLPEELELLKKLDAEEE